jgi:hypothetical protein
MPAHGGLQRFFELHETLIQTLSSIAEKQWNDVFLIN